MAVSISLAITQNSQNVTSNTSNVTATATLKWTYGSWNATGECYGSITIDGKAYSFSGLKFNTSNKSSGSQVIMTKTVNVTHTADGSKKLDCSTSFYTGLSSGTITATASKTLTTIPRATQPVIYTSNIDMGNNITIDLPRASSSFAHVLRYEFEGAKDFISGYAEDKVDWVIPLDLANSIPNAESGILYIYCDTYNGETLIGTKSVNLTINVPSNVIPTVSIATTDPTGYKDKYGAFIQGFSKFKTEVTASGVYGSTIKSYKVEADGKTYTSVPVTTDVISGSGGLAIKATVTDSRNRASAVSGVISVLPYTAPKIKSFSVYRCNEEGEKVNNGGYLAVAFSAITTYISNLNSAEYVVKYKKSTDTEYTPKTLTDYSGKSFVSNGVFIFAADTSSSYDVVLTVSDDFTSVEKSATGSSIKKLWSILKKGFGFAFGKIAELENTLEVALDALFHNKANFLQGLQINGTDLDYIVEQGEIDGWFYRKWNSGTAECWKIYYGTGINAAASNYNGFYYSNGIRVPLPFEFANLPTVTVDGGSTANMNFVRVFGQYKDAVNFIVVGMTNVTSTDITVDIKAIGKWK